MHYFHTIHIYYIIHYIFGTYDIYNTCIYDTYI